jgi:hypothetical protein
MSWYWLKQNDVDGKLKMYASIPLKTKAITLSITIQPREKTFKLQHVSADASDFLFSPDILKC